MNLRFNILGFTLASVELDLSGLVSGPSSDAPSLTLDARKVSALDKGIKAMSGFWVRRMMAG